jgi:hypothetical protein
LVDLPETWAARSAFARSARMKARGPEKAGVGGSIPSPDHLEYFTIDWAVRLGSGAQRKEEPRNRL